MSELSFEEELHAERVAIKQEELAALDYFHDIRNWAVSRKKQASTDTPNIPPGQLHICFRWPYFSAEKLKKILKRSPLVRSRAVYDWHHYVGGIYVCYVWDMQKTIKCFGCGYYGPWMGMCCSYWDELAQVLAKRYSEDI